MPRTLVVYSVPGLVDYCTAWSWQHSLVNIMHNFSQSIEHTMQRAFGVASPPDAAADATASNSIASACASTGLTPAELDACLRDAIEYAAARHMRGKDVLLLCEHPPVYTTGRAGALEHVKFTQHVPYIADVVHRFSAAASVVPTFARPERRSAAVAAAATSAPATPPTSATTPPHSTSAHVPIYRVDRGGQVTFHGPGQVVGYPLLNLRYYKQDLHWYMRQVEQVVINVCQRYGVEEPDADGRRRQVRRDPAYTGVWVDQHKVCAVGLACSRWYTWHGFGLNVDTDLAHFERIVPCGIHEDQGADRARLGVTRLADVAWGGGGSGSMRADASAPSRSLSLSRDAVRRVVSEEFASVFGVQVEWIDGTPQALIEQYAAHALVHAV